MIAEAQNWSYLDAMYYCFVSLFTIGFGGIQLEEESTLWICALYLLFGVTLLSTCCHILHQEVTTNLKKYRSVKRRNRLILTEIEANKVDNASWPQEEPISLREADTVIQVCIHSHLVRFLCSVVRKILHIMQLPYLLTPYIYEKMLFKIFSWCAHFCNGICTLYYLFYMVTCVDT